MVEEISQSEIEAFIDNNIDGPIDKYKTLLKDFKRQDTKCWAEIIFSPEFRKIFSTRKEIAEILSKREIQIFEELMIHIPLKYIYWRSGVKYGQLFPPTDQRRKPLCWAHSIASAIVLTSRRIIGRDELSFNDVKKYLVDTFEKEGKYFDEDHVLPDAVKKYGLRFDLIKNKAKINQFNPDGSYTFYIGEFILTDEQWDEFSNFFETYKTKALQSENLSQYVEDNKNVGHAALLIDSDDHTYTFLNSWGQKWGYDGKFKVAHDALPDLKFYGVHFILGDITDEEISCFEKRIETAIENFYEIFDYAYLLHQIEDKKLINIEKINFENLLNQFMEDYWKPGKETALIKHEFIEKVNNDSSILCEFGKILRKGINIKVNKKESFKFYKMAADLGNADAMVWCGKMLYYEDISFSEISNNYDEALQYFEKAINLGNARAMYYYALILKNGYGVPVDKEKAAKYSKKAADLGNSKAMNLYAYMLEHGEGISSDINEAIKYYKKAIDHKNAFAMYNYAHLLYYGKGVQIDKKKSAEYLKMSSDLGFPNAMFIYAQMLQYGYGIPVDKKEAFKLYERASDKGNSDAMYCYAYMSQHGDGVPINKEEAIAFYRKAIKERNPYAMFEYGLMLEQGDDSEVSEEKANELANKYYTDAIKLFKEKIEDEIPDAMYHYAKMLQYGYGCTIDKEKAIELYKMAIEHNSSKAMNSYAYMLFVGDGVPVDQKEAIKYFKKAADLGNHDAYNNLGYILKNGIGVPVEIEEAVKYYKKSIEIGNSSAMYNYAYMLENGDGVPVNKEEAKRLYTESEKRQNEGAKKRLQEKNNPLV